LALTGALAGGETTDSFGGSEIFQQAATSALLGLTGGTVGFGGQSNGTLFSVILNALQTDAESNILSTPSIVALNNEEALVSVGQEIPISSGQVLGDANSNPFQTTERREIGVILSVTPRIGDDNTIRLDIDQEVSSIDDTIGTVTTDFILNQSQLQTKIIANDGELIVLGGLVTAQDTIAVAKVPLLGDLPGVGRLFQSKETARATGNLMVFIRPTIIEDEIDARAATDRSYNYIRARQILANEGGPASLDQFVGEVLNGELPDTGTDTAAGQ
jgi:general secretion pathway protein D